MRKNIYGVYKALRHFGVTASEISEIAKCYKTWLDCPIAEKSSYHWVYYFNGTLVSMPFPIKSLNEDDKLIGYGIGDLVFTVCQTKMATMSQIESSLQDFNAVLNKRMLGVCRDADIHVQLPTVEEAAKIFSVFANDWLVKLKPMLSEISKDLPKGLKVQVDFTAANEITDMWVASSSEDAEKSIVQFGHDDSGPYYAECTPGKRTKSTICAVLHLRKGVDFIGKVGKYGTPNRDTLEMFRLLSDSLY